jgi:hypothetical protein
MKPSILERELFELVRENDYEVHTCNDVINTSSLSSEDIHIGRRHEPAEIDIFRRKIITPTGFIEHIVYESDNTDRPFEELIIHYAVGVEPETYLAEFEYREFARFSLNLEEDAEFIRGTDIVLEVFQPKAYSFIKGSEYISNIGPLLGCIQAMKFGSETKRLFAIDADLTNLFQTEKEDLGRIIRISTDPRLPDPRWGGRESYDTNWVRRDEQGCRTILKYLSELINHTE